MRGLPISLTAIKNVYYIFNTLDGDLPLYVDLQFREFYDFIFGERIIFGVDFGSSEVEIIVLAFEGCKID